MLNVLASLISFLLALINDLGYFGIFVAMAIESSIIPLPSEIILIPAGALIAQGELAFFPVLVASILGSVLGALFNYYLAFFLGRKTIEALIKRYGSFLFLHKKHLKRTDVYFKKHGDITTFVGRLLPGLRHLISLPAGFAKMPLKKFILFTALGAGIWSCVLLTTGYFFGGSASTELKIVIALLIFFSFIIALVYYLNKRKK